MRVSVLNAIVVKSVGLREDLHKGVLSVRSECVPVLQRWSGLGFYGQVTMHERSYF